MKAEEVDLRKKTLETNQMKKKFVNFAEKIKEIVEKY